MYITLCNCIVLFLYLFILYLLYYVDVLLCLIFLGIFQSGRLLLKHSLTSATKHGHRRNYICAILSSRCV